MTINKIFKFFVLLALAVVLASPQQGAIAAVVERNEDASFSINITEELREAYLQELLDDGVSLQPEEVELLIGHLNLVVDRYVLQDDGEVVLIAKGVARDGASVKRGATLRTKDGTWRLIVAPWCGHAIAIVDSETGLQDFFVPAINDGETVDSDIDAVLAIAEHGIQPSEDGDTQAIEDIEQARRDIVKLLRTDEELLDKLVHRAVESLLVDSSQYSPRLFPLLENDSSFKEARDSLQAPTPQSSR